MGDTQTGGGRAGMSGLTVLLLLIGLSVSNALIRRQEEETRKVNARLVLEQLRTKAALRSEQRLSYYNRIALATRELSVTNLLQTDRILEEWRSMTAMNTRADQLDQLARAYVLEGLGKCNFDAIPYAETVTLRAPLCPGDSEAPISGKANLRSKWWAPLPDLVAGVEVIDTYVNQDLTAVAVEFLCHIRQPACTLRVMDRFTVDESGLIVEQENFFDPRDVTHPGWQRT